MGRFPRSFEYRGYAIRRTSFNWHVVGPGVDDIKESIQDCKDIVDQYIEDKHERSKKVNTLDVDERLSDLLS